MTAERSFSKLKVLATFIKEKDTVKGKSFFGRNKKNAILAASYEKKEKGFTGQPFSDIVSLHINIYSKTI